LSRVSSHYSEKLLDHFRNPRHAGELPPPARTVEVANPACGDILRLSALIENGRVARAGFLVRGCTASIAAGSALTTLMLNRPLADLRTIDAAALEAALDGLPGESRHAAVLSIDALRALLRLLE
jgi:NifU-like protein involved in Fe-S cluster formation